MEVAVPVFEFARFQDILSFLRSELIDEGVCGVLGSSVLAPGPGGGGDFATGFSIVNARGPDGFR